MARADSFGMFWQDEAKVKAAPKEKIVRTPPERFWEKDDYLPGYAEALLFKFDLYTDAELIHAAQVQEKLLYDIEVYPNYCLFAFKGMTTGKIIYFELTNDDDFMDGADKFFWVLSTFCLVNFNGRKYDFPITAMAVHGCGTKQMWSATAMIIADGMQPREAIGFFKVKPIVVNQIDLIELTALAPGLKVCAGRLHAPRMQDLPFKPGTHLNADQITILRWYCVNDLDNTHILFKATEPQIQLREQMSARYKLDLRSHSDAQMAEAIINSEVRKASDRKFIARTTLDAGTAYRYQTPRFVKFQTPLMLKVLDVVQKATFEIDEYLGSVIMPPELGTMTIPMNKSVYKIGIGGLHSQEKSIAHIADDEYFIADTDATSYYPRLILNAGLTPESLGKDFIYVYDRIVTERVNAKAKGDKVTAEVLKIVANGTFGKLGSPWSIMYAPNLLLQVTITGQLAILMLAESFELAGIEVTSINTDGIVVRCKRVMEDVFHGVVKAWEKQTGFQTEEIRYSATYSRDINNYLAVYEVPEKGKLFKTKGAYAETAPKKNAVNEICITAIKELIAHGTPIMTTLTACKDITQFTTMRSVSGGAVKDDVYLGKVIRWYYATGVEGEIIYAKSGNKVARSDGARPLMDLPAEFPTDVDYDWYAAETYKILEDIGYSKPAVSSAK
jgi:hypothetical protein